MVTIKAALDETCPIYKAIDRGGGQTCDIAGVLRELDAAGYAIVPKKPAPPAKKQDGLDMIASEKVKAISDKIIDLLPADSKEALTVLAINYACLCVAAEVDDATAIAAVRMALGQMRAGAAGRMDS